MLGSPSLCGASGFIVAPFVPGPLWTPAIMVELFDVPTIIPRIEGVPCGINNAYARLRVLLLHYRRIMPDLLAIPSLHFPLIPFLERP